MAEVSAADDRPDVLWDGRFRGQHGIARFGQESYRHLAWQPTTWTTDRCKPYSPAGALEMAVELRRRKTRFLISPSYAAAPAGPYQQILTVHDLILLDVEAESSRGKQAYFKYLVRPAIRRAGVVMTVSEFSRRRIVDWSGLEPEQVVVVGNGCSMPLVDPALDKPRAERPYLLYVGNERPHKNFSLVTQAMALLTDDIDLVTVGLSESFVAARCAEAGIPGHRVRTHRHISDATLLELYDGAEVLAVPSTYEGFGLIALEALARGVPSVYCCDAVGEVVGDTGFRSSDPHDAEGYADALRRALARPRASGALVSRASMFRWSDVGQRVSDVIRTVTGQ